MERAGIERLVFRADSSVAIGTGHVMRCLALAQAWSDAGGKACFLTANENGALETRLRSEGCEVVRPAAVPGSADDAQWTADWAKKNGAPWAVIDGYHFGVEYQRALRDSGLRLLCIDDNGHAERYCADIVLNQNLYADEALYENREPQTRLLLGCRYLLLRREFFKWRDWMRKIPEMARKLLVTFGGADAGNATLKAIESLRRLERRDLEIKIVVGPAYAHVDALRRETERATGRVELLTAVRDVPALMAWADVAISAGGSTCWEIAFMGLPACIVVLADNQSPVADVLEKRGAAINLGWHGTDVPDKLAGAMEQLLGASDRRRAMSRVGRLMVDGDGSKRVVNSIQERFRASLGA
ncbi:MAG TPA: UDP-2,4-diacetamido-2,4,6-trideoxy-beta-L-altropyranose hydrolase [Candidatus Binatia bacterium]